MTEFGVNHLAIRGFGIAELIENESFLGMITLMLTGKEAPLQLNCMLDRILVAWVDHGEEPPSTQAVRAVAATHQTLSNAVIAGLATFGGVHVPIVQAGGFLQQMVLCVTPEEQLAFVKSFKRVPGFGHPVHTYDPRVSPLLKSAALNMLDFQHVQALHDTEKALARILNESTEQVEPVHANLAGVTAALWLDLGFSLDTVGLLPVLGRCVGWAAHYAEQRAKPPFMGYRPPN